MGLKPPQPKKPEKGSMLQKEKKPEVEVPKYSDTEKIYIRNLQKRLDDAQEARDEQHEEFDNMSYHQYYLDNDRKANTMLVAKKNKSDTIFQSGTLRNKMMAFLSTFQGLNLQGEISAFNDREVPLNVLGSAMEDIIEKTEELENDEEKKMIREYELLKQGTLFAEEVWFDEWVKRKKITRGFIGQINGVKWTTTQRKTIGRPKREIISGLGVYLGDLSKYFIEDQPYIFTVEVKNYEEVKQIYKDWDRWKYVSQEKQTFSSSITGNEMANNLWRLLPTTEKGQVEVIKYQDKPNQEFQIILNGVPMLPMGYPFPWGHGEYSIIQQNLEPIRHNFAYGKSFIFKNKNLVILLDEMMKLAVLKTQKSFMPPYLNLSSRTISKKMFMPGQMTRGVKANEIAPVNDKETQGVTTSEFNMIQEIMRYVDANTASQTFTGQRETGQNPTATQIIEIQRQARIMMGNLVLAVSLLEKKLTQKRLLILLENWFTPIDKELDEARTALKNKYRIVSRERMIEGVGAGVRMTVMAEEIPAPHIIKKREDVLEKQFGVPFRIMVLNPKQIQEAKITWQVTVNAKDKKSSENSKVMFGLEIAEAREMGLRINPEYIEERFAEIWDENPNKLFMREGPGAPQPAPAGAPAGGQGRGILPGRISPPKVGVGEGNKSLTPQLT